MNRPKPGLSTAERVFDLPPEFDSEEEKKTMGLKTGMYRRCRIQCCSMLSTAGNVMVKPDGGVDIVLSNEDLPSAILSLSLSPH